MKRKRKKRRLDGPIHARIRKLREGLGLNQEQLGAAVGVDNTAVCHWENGLARPDISRIPAVAEALRVSVGELIEGEKAWAALASMLTAAGAAA